MVLRSPWLVLAVAATAACGFDDGAGTGGGGIDGGGGGSDGGGGGDAAGAIDGGGSETDAGVDCSDLLPFEPSNFSVCDLLYDPRDLTLDAAGTYQLNTATGVLTLPNDDTTTLEGVVITQTDAPPIFAVFVRSFTLSGVSSLSVRGPNALALVTRRALVVNGALGVPASATLDGAGGDHFGACNQVGRGRQGVIQENAAGTLSGGSGGGGGAFGADGGRGEVVDNADNPEVTEGGVANGNASLVPLRGGCKGGAGGEPLVSGGPGGGAGGAIQLVAGGALRVTGYVTARGGGGRGVLGPSGGGGGGGSGGGILVEASSITVDGALTANGGGGGEGGRGAGTTDSGSNGHDFDGGGASGGSMLSFGGNGGTGGAFDPETGEDGQVGVSNSGALAGGGGGGGSAGRIHLRSLGDLTIGPFATISPAAQ